MRMLVPLNKYCGGLAVRDSVLGQSTFELNPRTHQRTSLGKLSLIRCSFAEGLCSF
jgi:hypothetical protein